MEKIKFSIDKTAIHNKIGQFFHVPKKNKSYFTYDLTYVRKLDNNPEVCDVCKQPMRMYEIIWIQPEYKNSKGRRETIQTLRGHADCLVDSRKPIRVNTTQVKDFK